MFGNSYAHIQLQLTVTSTQQRSRPVRQSFNMADSKRVFLGCWVSLDEQDRLCEVSLDRSAVEEVSGPSEQQIDSIFQACKSPVNPAINRLLTCPLSVTTESRYAVREMHPLILSSYSTTTPPLLSRLMSIHRPRLLLNDPGNVFGQRATQEWRHGARVEQGRSLHRDVEADFVRIPRKRRPSRSASQTIPTTVHPGAPSV